MAGVTDILNRVTFGSIGPIRRLAYGTMTDVEVDELVGKLLADASSKQNTDNEMLESAKAAKEKAAAAREAADVNRAKTKKDNPFFNGFSAVFVLALVLAITLSFVFPLTTITICTVAAIPGSVGAYNGIIIPLLRRASAARQARGARQKHEKLLSKYIKREKALPGRKAAVFKKYAREIAEIVTNSAPYKRTDQATKDRVKELLTALNKSNATKQQIGEAALDLITILSPSTSKDTVSQMREAWEANLPPDAQQAGGSNPAVGGQLGQDGTTNSPKSAGLARLLHDTMIPDCSYSPKRAGQNEADDLLNPPCKYVQSIDAIPSAPTSLDDREGQSIYSTSRPGPSGVARQKGISGDREGAHDTCQTHHTILDDDDYRWLGDCQASHCKAIEEHVGDGFRNQTTQNPQGLGNNLFSAHPGQEHAVVRRDTRLLRAAPTEGETENLQRSVGDEDSRSVQSLCIDDEDQDPASRHGMDRTPPSLPRTEGRRGNKSGGGVASTLPAESSKKGGRRRFWFLGGKKSKQSATTSGHNPAVVHVDDAQLRGLSLLLPPVPDARRVGPSGAVGKSQRVR